MKIVPIAHQKAIRRVCAKCNEPALQRGGKYLTRRGARVWFGPCCVPKPAPAVQEN